MHLMTDMMIEALRRPDETQRKPQQIRLPKANWRELFLMGLELR